MTDIVRMRRNTAARKSWEKRRLDPDRHQRHMRQQWLTKLKTKYGITVNDYQRMLVKQDYACKICSRSSIGDRKLCVDHDHSTGEVRGLLCDSCNLILGRFNDDPALLDRAADYLRGATP